MKTCILVVLFALLAGSHANAQEKTVTPDELGRIRVSVSLWLNPPNLFRSHIDELRRSATLIGPSVLTDDRVWGETDFTVQTPDGKNSFKIALKAYPHHNLDGTWTAIVDMSTTELNTPTPDNTHRLWNTITPGKISPFMLSRIKLTDGSYAIPIVTLTIYPTRPS